MASGTGKPRLKEACCYFQQEGCVFIGACLFVSRITQKLLNPCSQNSVERWHVSQVRNNRVWWLTRSCYVTVTVLLTVTVRCKMHDKLQDTGFVGNGRIILHDTSYVLLGVWWQFYGMSGLGGGMRSAES